MKTALTNLLGLFYPKKCPTCAKIISNYEEILCLSCRMELPETNFTENEGNMIEKSFYGRIPIEQATSLLFFSKRGIVQRLIHQLKYGKQEQIGRFLGEWLGTEMLHSNRFNSLDCIVPVPLHPKKLKKRGYNQVRLFGECLSDKLNIPIIENKLLRVSKTNTQTYKNRFERGKNITEIFELSDINIFKNQHILLIDDVLTTGATLESCCIQLIKTEKIKISIATMVITE